MPNASHICGVSLHTVMRCAIELPSTLDKVIVEPCCLPSTPKSRQLRCCSPTSANRDVERSRRNPIMVLQGSPVWLWLGFRRGCRRASSIGSATCAVWVGTAFLCSCSKDHRGLPLIRASPDHATLPIAGERHVAQPPSGRRFAGLCAQSSSLLSRHGHRGALGPPESHKDGGGEEEEEKIGLASIPIR